MIERFEQNIEDYKEELDNLSDNELLVKERHSFMRDGKPLNELEAIRNEKIKISKTFTRYIIERCKPSQVNPLRRLVESYEQRIDSLKKNRIDINELENLKKMTVVIDLLFGIDISYYFALEELYRNSKIYDIFEYISELIDYKINFDNIYQMIQTKGYGRK